MICTKPSDIFAFRAVAGPLSAAESRWGEVDLVITYNDWQVVHVPLFLDEADQVIAELQRAVDRERQIHDMANVSPTPFQYVCN